MDVKARSLKEGVIITAEEKEELQECHTIKRSPKAKGSATSSEMAEYERYLEEQNNNSSPESPPTTGQEQVRTTPPSVRIRLAEGRTLQRVCLRNPPPPRRSGEMWVATGSAPGRMVSTQEFTQMRGLRSPLNGSSTSSSEFVTSPPLLMTPSIDLPGPRIREFINLKPRKSESFPMSPPRTPVNDPMYTETKGVLSEYLGRNACEIKNDDLEELIKEVKAQIAKDNAERKWNEASPLLKVLTRGKSARGSPKEPLGGQTTKRGIIRIQFTGKTMRQRGGHLFKKNNLFRKISSRISFLKDIRTSAETEALLPKPFIIPRKPVPIRQLPEKEVSAGTRAARNAIQKAAAQSTKINHWLRRQSARLGSKKSFVIVCSYAVEPTKKSFVRHSLDHPDPLRSHPFRGYEGEAQDLGTSDLKTAPSPKAAKVLGIEALDFENNRYVDHGWDHNATYATRRISITRKPVPTREESGSNFVDDSIEELYEED